MLFKELAQKRHTLRVKIDQAWLAPEADSLEGLLPLAKLSERENAAVIKLATELVTQVREQPHATGTMETFLQEYELSSQEGVVLMCLAEALLRIPDAATADELIQDKLSHADWESHLGRSDSLLVNASTWGLLLTGKLIQLDAAYQGGLSGLLTGLVNRSSEPLIRNAIKQAMRIMAQQFVMGRDMDEAWLRCASDPFKKFRVSFDMLGEAALTSKDAQQYFRAYKAAIDYLAREPEEHDVYRRAGISIKLSALHPRFDAFQQHRVRDELVNSVAELAVRAARANITLTIDAEEAEVLDLTLDIFAGVLRQIKGDWQGFGLAVQTYQKRALPVLQYLKELSEQSQRRLPIRLVKGAYWDTELKRAQERGLENYPVFTRKVSTDVSYLACARYLWQHRRHFYCQFATHNAHTVAYILNMAAGDSDFEFQRLHGMGENLYRQVMSSSQIRCRVYAPVGSHEDLLPYLVRRLLENGANTSFVHRIEDKGIPVAQIVADPVERLSKLLDKPHPHIPLPPRLFGPGRKNAMGFNFWDEQALQFMDEKLTQFASSSHVATGIIDGKAIVDKEVPLYNPADLTEQVGTAGSVTLQQVSQALKIAHQAFTDWNQTPAEERAQIIIHAADLMEQDMIELVYLCVKEAGRSVVDAMAELREAIDFCRYYGQQIGDFWGQRDLPGPTGEDNSLSYRGRGVFCCISPWNFPLSLFTGQVVAALVSGNCVLAKPAGLTPLGAYAITKLLHRAGIPEQVLHFLPCSGEDMESVFTDPRLAGVAFTGSLQTAQHISRLLATRKGAIVPLVAETGGQNAMIVDSSALPEQVVTDVLRSAFNSAGQRCSALRVLFLQDDIAPRIIDMLQGALEHWQIGDPGLLCTDMGPMISADARDRVIRHIEACKQQHNCLFDGRTMAYPEAGYFLPPHIIGLDGISRLKEEVFGPVLHIVQFNKNKMFEVLNSINLTGYGLTLGIHSRIESTVKEIISQTRVGNIYVNRNMVGAVVGVQPFGGEGLSGTGPKAGGPNYLARFMTELSVSTNTTAAGGNAALLAMKE